MSETGIIAGTVGATGISAFFAALVGTLGVVGIVLLLVLIYLLLAWWRNKSYGLRRIKEWTWNPWNWFGGRYIDEFTKWDIQPEHHKLLGDEANL